MFRSIAALSALLMAVSPALSQSSSSASDHVRSLVVNGLDVPTVQQRVFNDLFRLAPSGRLTQDIADTVARRDEAKKRQDTLSKILRNDLDGDGNVSAKEIDRVRGILQGHERVSFETMVLEVDSDEDGILSGAEIANRVDAEIAEMRESAGRRGLQATAFLEFDIDGDGVVDVEEVKASIKSIAKDALQAKEQHLSNYSGDLKSRKPVRTCNLPAPSANALAVYIGGGRGISLSTAAVDGLDEETSFATLEIEKGSKPLYIVAVPSGVTVLRVTGATERVERFVGAGSKAVGVIGLPAEIVEFVSSSDCDIPSASQPETIDWSRANSALTYALERKVQMISDSRFGRLKVPSGQNKKPVPATSASRYNALVIRKGKQRFRMTENGFEETNPLASDSETEPSAIANIVREFLGTYPGELKLSHRKTF